MATKAKLIALIALTTALGIGTAALSHPRTVYAQSSCPGGTQLCPAGCVAVCNADKSNCTFVCPSQPPQAE